MLLEERDAADKPKIQVLADFYINYIRSVFTACCFNNACGFTVISDFNKHIFKLRLPPKLQR